VGILKEEIQKYPHEVDVDEEGSWDGGAQMVSANEATPKSSSDVLSTNQRLVATLHVLLVASIVYQNNLF